MDRPGFDVTAAAVGRYCEPSQWPVGRMDGWMEWPMNVIDCGNLDRDALIYRI